MKNFLLFSLLGSGLAMGSGVLAFDISEQSVLSFEEVLLASPVQSIRQITNAAEFEGVERMDQAMLEKLVKNLADEGSEPSGEGGRVQFQFNGVSLVLLSSEAHDRMRIITPVAEYASLSAEQLALAMAANFHTALDARYALSNGVLYSAYIHPLVSLTAQQVESAVTQVATLAQTFGTSYSSGALNFGGPKKADDVEVGGKTI